MSQTCSAIESPSRPDSDPVPWRGRRPLSLDRDLAALNKDVYADTGSWVDGWKPLSSAELEAAGISPKMLSDPESGFHARIYASRDHGYALVLRGTDEARDWISNLRQGIGLDDIQYRQAVALAVSARSAFGNNLVISGHSLGGGLAAVASLRTGIPAVTFNAAGVHDGTLDRFGIAWDVRHLAAETGHIRRYTVDNDILTAVQEHEPHLRHLLPDPIGHRIRLPDPDPLSLLSRLRPYKKLAHALETHSMDTVIRAMDAPPEPEGRSHPGAALVAQSIRALHRLEGVRRIANLPGHEVVNAAAYLAARARESGMSSIDHLACSADGSRLFAIQGSPQDPAQRRAAVDVDTAASVPARSSAAAIRAGVPDAATPPLVPRFDWQQAHYALGH